LARSEAFLARWVAKRCSVAALSEGPVSQLGSLAVPGGGDVVPVLVGADGCWRRRDLEASLGMLCVCVCVVGAGRVVKRGKVYKQI